MCCFLMVFRKLYSLLVPTRDQKYTSWVSALCLETGLCLWLGECSVCIQALSFLFFQHNNYFDVIPLAYPEITQPEPHPTGESADPADKIFVHIACHHLGTGNKTCPLQKFYLQPISDVMQCMVFRLLDETADSMLKPHTSTVSISTQACHYGGVEPKCTRPL